MLGLRKCYVLIEQHVNSWKTEAMRTTIYIVCIRAKRNDNKLRNFTLLAFGWSDWFGPE